MAHEQLGDPATRAALRTSATWLGVGVAVLPVFDITDRHGLLSLVGAPSLIEADLVLWPVLQIAFFVAVGMAVAALMRRHRPRGRTWFFAGCALPVLGYVLLTGLRLAVVAAILSLSFAFVQLRLARDARPLA